MATRLRKYSAGDTRLIMVSGPPHPSENDLFGLHEDQHGNDRCERCRTPQPLLRRRWELPRALGKLAADVRRQLQLKSEYI
jgi:hypothetical protein